MILCCLLWCWFLSGCGFVPFLSEEKKLVELSVSSNSGWQEARGGFFCPVLVQASEACSSAGCLH